jgi:hypothetical protein
MQACTQKHVDQCKLPPEFRINLRNGQSYHNCWVDDYLCPCSAHLRIYWLCGHLYIVRRVQYLALLHSLRPRAFRVEVFYRANYLLILLSLIPLLLIMAFYFGKIAAIPSAVGLVIVRNHLAGNQHHGQCSIRTATSRRGYLDGCIGYVVDSLH